MVKFLNQFSRKCKQLTKEEITYLDELFQSFLLSCDQLPRGVFLRNGRFNVALFESVFAAACREAVNQERFLEGDLSAGDIAELEDDEDFQKALIEGTTQTKNVKLRLERAAAIIPAL